MLQLEAPTSRVKNHLHLHVSVSYERGLGRKAVVLHLGQQGPGGPVVALLGNLQRGQALAGKGPQRGKHGTAQLWLDEGDTVHK